MKSKTHLHTHITVTEYPSNHIKGWKRTTINLCKGSKIQQDKMLTKHYYLDNISSVIDTILSDIEMLSLDNILRIKIEQESNFPEVISEGNYLEIHAETTKNCSLQDWVLSYNTKNATMNFINRRFYSGNISDRLHQVDDELKKLNAEYRPELIIYDSNHDLDSWWA